MSPQNLSDPLSLEERRERCVRALYARRLKRAIRETGGYIDLFISPERARYWIENPERYPKRFRDKNIFLWKTFDPEARRITCLQWYNGRVFSYSFSVGDIGELPEMAKIF